MGKKKDKEGKKKRERKRGGEQGNKKREGKRGKRRGKENRDIIEKDKRGPNPSVCRFARNVYFCAQILAEI